MQTLCDFIFDRPQDKVFFDERGNRRYVIHEYSIKGNQMTVDTGGVDARVQLPILTHLQDIYIPTMTLEELKILQAYKNESSR